MDGGGRCGAPAGRSGEAGADGRSPSQPPPRGGALRAGFSPFGSAADFCGSCVQKNHRPAENAGEEDTMIKITPDFPCIHCGLCAEACSHGVIKMVPDEEGRLIPKVAFSSCRYCRACRRACPVIPAEEV